MWKACERWASSLSSEIRLGSRLSFGAKKVIRVGMTVDFQGFTQIQSVDGFTIPSLGLYVRGLAESAVAGSDRRSEGGHSVLPPSSVEVGIQGCCL